jgi:hypothetical protein
MNYKRKTSKYYLHKEINLIMFKLYNLKQLFFILKKIQFVDGYKNIIKKLPKISNVILNSLLEKIVIELSGLVVDHNEDDLSIMSFIIKYHQYESDYKEKRYIYIYDINTNKKHRVYINTNSIKDDINELEQYIQNNEYIKKYIKKLRDKQIAHNDRRMSFNKNYRYDDLKTKVTYEELEQYIDNLFFYMNRIYSTLFKIKFAYYNELDSELKYLDSILSINNEDIRKILLKNIGSDICD